MSSIASDDLSTRLAATERDLKLVSRFAKSAWSLLWQLNPHNLPGSLDAMWISLFDGPGQRDVMEIARKWAVLAAPTEAARGLAVTEADLRAESVRRGKMLVWMRDKLIHVSDNLDDEGDRVAFGSTNDCDTLKDVIQRLNDFNWAQIMDEKTTPDLIGQLRQVHIKNAALQARIGELEAALRTSPPETVGGGEPSYAEWDRAAYQTAALSSAPPAEETWQAIETAPKDGTLIDVWAHWPEHDKSRRHTDVRWVKEGDQEGWEFGDFRSWMFTYPPQVTHWRPRPLPPAPAGEAK